VVIPQGTTVLWTQLQFKPENPNHETCRLTMQGEAIAGAGPSRPSHLLYRDGKRPRGW
jgi:hypothetical protein